MGRRRWIWAVWLGAVCSAILGTGCTETTSEDAPTAETDTVTNADREDSGPIVIDDEFDYELPAQASARR